MPGFLDPAQGRLRSRLRQLRSRRYASRRAASSLKPSDVPGPTSTSMSAMTRRPAHSWAMKLSSAAQELIAMMVGPANRFSVILSISKAPGEYLPYPALKAVFQV